MNNPLAMTALVAGLLAAALTGCGDEADARNGDGDAGPTNELDDDTSDDAKEDDSAPDDSSGDDAQDDSNEDDSDQDDSDQDDSDQDDSDQDDSDQDDSDQDDSDQDDSDQDDSDQDDSDQDDSDEDDSQDDAEDSFISALPNAGSDVGAAEGSSTASPAPGTTTGDSATDAGQEVNVEEAIAEADILLREGDVLYALSQYAGLAIVDISNPADLRLLGRQHFERTPFEMYLDGSEVVVLFYGYGEYGFDPVTGYYDYSETSSIATYDIGNPANISLVDVVEVDGSLLDSRRVGDRLYVVTTDYSYCWNCSATSGAHVASFDLAGSGLGELDRLDIPRDGDWAYTPTINVNEQRLYLATTSYGYVDADGEPIDPNETNGGMVDSDATFEPMGMMGDAPPPPVDGAVDGGASEVPEDDDIPEDEVEWIYTSVSSLQVVDISAASGALVLGAKVPVSGEVVNRWQVDEFEGTLRVVAQRNAWSEPPVLDTYQVVSSSEFVKLAELPIELPRPESLQSVRFDGDRGYVVTFEQTDPLFTLDLSDPAAPAQLGELEIPGWLFHMMPRGDRLYAVGYDFDNVDSLHASVFDVSDLTQPTMLSRVNFGSSWGSFAEQADRIEKSVQLLDDEQLLLVPYAGYEMSDGCWNYNDYRSGIQLIDVARDSLTLRGDAPAVGFARRALVHREHLLGYSDQALQSFDISDRDAPVQLDVLTLSRTVEYLAVVGDNLVRIGSNGLGRTLVDVTPVSDPNAALTAASVELELPASDGCGYTWFGHPIEHDGVLYVPRYYEDYSFGVNHLSFGVIDVRDPSAPVSLGSVDVPTPESGYWHGDILETDDALVIAQFSETYDYGSDGTPSPGVPIMGGPEEEMVAVNQNEAPASDAGGSSTMPGEMVAAQGSEPTVAYDGGWSRSLKLVVFDLTDPELPVHTETVTVPDAWLDAGFGQSPQNSNVLGPDGYKSLPTLLSGEHIVASQHHEPLEDGSGTRYYLDRLDLSDPADPVWLPSLNIPGQIVALLEGDTGALTLESAEISLEDAECVDYVDYTVCFNKTLQLSSIELEETRAVRTGKTDLGLNRDWSEFAWDGAALYRSRWDEQRNTNLISAYGTSAESLGELDTSELDDLESAGIVRLGSRVGLTNGATLALLSTSTGAVEVAGSGQLGYWCNFWQLAGTSTALCPLGNSGVATVELE